MYSSVLVYPFVVLPLLPSFSGLGFVVKRLQLLVLSFLSFGVGVLLGGSFLFCFFCPSSVRGSIVLFGGRPSCLSV